MYLLRLASELSSCRVIAIPWYVWLVAPFLICLCMSCCTNKMKQHLIVLCTCIIMRIDFVSLGGLFFLKKIINTLDSFSKNWVWNWGIKLVLLQFLNPFSKILYAVMSLLTCKKNPIVCRVSSVKCTCYAWLLSFVQIGFFDMHCIFWLMLAEAHTIYLPKRYMLAVSSYLSCCVSSNALRCIVQKFTWFAHCR